MTYKKGANFYDSHEPKKGEKRYHMVNCWWDNCCISPCSSFHKLENSSGSYECRHRNPNTPTIICPKNVSIMNQSGVFFRKIPAVGIAYPLIVLHRMRAGALKWIGPLLGFVFMRFLKNLKYFIFCLTRPPDKQISSDRTTTWCHQTHSLQNSKSRTQQPPPRVTYSSRKAIT